MFVVKRVIPKTDGVTSKLTAGGLARVSIAAVNVTGLPLPAHSAFVLRAQKVPLYLLHIHSFQLYQRASWSLWHHIAFPCAIRGIVVQVVAVAAKLRCAANFDAHGFRGRRWQILWSLAVQREATATHSGSMLSLEPGLV